MCAVSTILPERRKRALPVNVLPDPPTPGNSEGAESNDPAPLGCVARATLLIGGNCENPETKSQ
jgi:hypothetical protein